MNEAFRRFANNLLESGKDLLPIVIVIAFFQIAVLQRPIPDFNSIALGTFYILIGLTLFISGLRTGLFPVGENLAHAFVQRGSLLWLLVFAFTLGFGTTIAEPALIAIANEAAKVAANGDIIPPDPTSIDSYASTLRITVAIAVGFAVVLGVFRILKGWSIQWLIIGGYLMVLLTTLIAPDWIIGIAYDSGGVTTSTITVPLVTALGVGLASGIRGRNPLTDGFGMIAICSLLPIIAVMIFGILL